MRGNLSSPAGIETGPSAAEVGSLNHWIFREVPNISSESCNIPVVIAGFGHDSLLPYLIIISILPRLLQIKWDISREMLNKW